MATRWITTRQVAEIRREQAQRLREAIAEQSRELRGDKRTATERQVAALLGTDDRGDERPTGDKRTATERQAAALRGTDDRADSD